MIQLCAHLNCTGTPLRDVRKRGIQAPTEAAGHAKGLKPKTMYLNNQRLNMLGKSNNVNITADTSCRLIRAKCKVLI